MMVGSLEGLNVVELGHGRAMRLAGHLLTEQGALVTSFGSVGTRREDSYLDRGKHRKPKERLDDALAHASIILADHRPQLQTDWGMNVDDLVSRYPNAVIVTFPAFLTGDEQAEDAPEAAVAALTGQYTDIHPVRQLFGLDPVYTPLPLGSIYAAVHGATACVLAHLNGRPGHIEAPLAGGAMTAMSSLWMDIERQPARYEAPRLPGVLKNIALPLIRRIARKGTPRSRQNCSASRASPIRH